MFYDTTTALLARLRLMLFCIPLKSVFISHAKILSSYNEAYRKKKIKKEKEIPFYNGASVEWRASVFLKCPNEQFLLAMLYDHTVVAF